METVTAPHPSARLAIWLLFFWIMLIGVILALLIADDLDDLERDFQLRNNELVTYVTERMQVAETTIEAFSSYVKADPQLDHERLSNVAGNLIKRYPYLYMFEVAERVTNDERAAFTRNLQQIYPQFEIRHFDYQNTRQWQSAPIADAYFPLVFQVPLYNDQRNILGLDLYSSKMLVETMQMSEHFGIAIASPPFKLAEDRLGYVIHRALKWQFKHNNELKSDRYALLALDAQQLFRLPSHLSGSMKVFLDYERVQDEEPGQYPRIFLNNENQQLSGWLPLLKFQKNLADKVPSQPLVYVSHWQPGWGDFSYWSMAMIIFIGILVPVVSKEFVSNFLRIQVENMTQTGELYRLANFDVLTQLPNRNRLIDHLEVQMIKAKKQQSEVTLVFIDLDGFQLIIDRYGHAAADFVLVQLSLSFSEHLRENEMLARYGNDEFVLVLDQYISDEQVDHLMTRLDSQLVRPLVYRKQEIDLNFSYGLARFPEDGVNIQALLDVADRRLFKQRQKKSVSF